MHDESPEKLADELEQAMDQMQGRSERLRKKTDAARHDWQAKRLDPKVPGAPSPEGEEEPA